MSPQGFFEMPSQLLHSGKFAKMSTKAVRTFYVLSSFANKDGVCWPVMSAIARIAGLTPPSVRKAVKELETLELIEVERSPQRKGNIYKMKWRENEREGE